MIDNQAMQLTNERWQAIMNNDKSYDNIFIYAVKSTGICCRPSCNSRDPKKKTSLFSITRMKQYQRDFGLVNGANQVAYACRMKNG